MEKSVPEPHFYRVSGHVEASTQAPDGLMAEVLEGLPTTAGPWSPSAQHGGPPAGLLVRAVERLPEAEGRVVGRVTMEFWGSIPVGPVRLTAQVVRPGRSVLLAESQLFDHARDRLVATARVWLFPRSSDGPGTVGPPLEHGPEDGRPGQRPTGWGAGYLDAVELRWMRGHLTEPGTGVAWMRAPRLVEGEETSPVQRLMSCADSASGVGSALDISEWAFLNTELTVHLLREPVGPWVCLEAETTLGPGSVAIATSTVHDRLGVVARTAQALLVTRR